MPSHDLSSIPGLEDKHRRALARHGVADLRDLAQVDPEVAYRAMANLRPRPTRDQVAGWQGEARSMLSEIGPDAADETVPDASEWHTAASFVVVFSQRLAGGTWEQRVEAERTEVEPERNPQVWSGWECEPICSWMLAQLGQTAGAGLTPANGPTHPAEARPAEPPTAEPSPPVKPVSERPALHIDSAALIDATGRADVLTAGAAVAGPRTELLPPVAVAFTVSGAPPETQLRAVARIRRRNGPGWNAQDPVVVPASGLVELDLSRVPAGEHDIDLIAWAPDARAKPVSITLPKLTIRRLAGA